MSKSDVFLQFEKIFFRIYLGFVALGFLILGAVSQVHEHLEQLAEAISGLMTAVLLSTVVAFFLGLFRIIKYLFVMRKQEERPTVWRSIVMVLTSPVLFVLFYIILFVLLLSMASCTYNG